MHKGGRERREMRKKKGQSEILKTLVRKGEGGDEILEKEEKGFFACYLLTSLSPRHKGHTYIGFTVNPRRRIRQHNGEMCSGAWRTKSKRPWEMVLCIHGFPTNVSALQFEWAWQHPLESLAVRKAAANLKSISGLASKIKIAYTMLTLPAWNSLNLTVNFFSTKYTKHYAGCPSLPDHMKVQVRPMDELPCYTNGDQFSYENEDDMDGEEEGGASGGSTDDQNSFEMPSHEQFGFVENELPLSCSISPVRRIHSAVDSFSTDEQYIQVRPMDDLPCYANGDQFSYENEDGMDGEDECGASGGSADDQNSFKLPSHEQFGFLENELPLLPSISPVRTIHSVVGSFSTDDQNIKQFGFRENEMPFSLSDSSVRTIPSLDGSISTNDQNITEILTDLTHEQCEDLPLSLTNSPVRTATSLDGSFSTDDRNITEMPTHERFGCGDSPLSLANSHVRTIASIKGSFSTEGNAEKKRNALLGLVEEDEAPDSLATSLEVETIDLCSPSPECRIRLCSKKRRACTGSPQIIDLTKSPIFVQL